MEQYGISKLDLKRRNRMQILKFLQQQGPTSRIDLSGVLELTRAAVTIITNEMIEQGVLYEKGEVNLAGQKASRGRKKVLIDINRNFKFAFGIAIDRKKVYIGLSNIGGDTLEKRICEIRPSDDKDGILQQIFTHMQEMMTNNCLEKSRLIGIGICLGEWANRFLELRTENGVVDYQPLQQMFEKGFGLPVSCDSIINGLGLMENDLFVQKTVGGPTVLIRFTDPIEATMTVDGEIYCGAHHRAMNFAHMVVNPNGKSCHCGNRGCLSSECSEDSIYVDIVDAFSEENTPLLYSRMGGNPNLLRVAEVSDYILLGDPILTELLNERLKSFGAFLNNMISVIDPERIIFLGNQFENEQYLSKLKAYISDHFGAEIANLITVGTLQRDQLYLSGCALAIRNFFVAKGGLDSEHRK